MSEYDAGVVAENSVVYRGFIIPTRHRPPLTMNEMNGFRNECLNALGHRLAGCIWQEEPFVLNAVARSASCGESGLGRSCVISLCGCLIFASLKTCSQPYAFAFFRFSSFGGIHVFW